MECSWSDNGIFAAAIARQPFWSTDAAWSFLLIPHGNYSIGSSEATALVSGVAAQR